MIIINTLYFLSISLTLAPWSSCLCCSSMVFSPSSQFCRNAVSGIWNSNWNCRTRASSNWSYREQLPLQWETRTNILWFKKCHYNCFKSCISSPYLRIILCIELLHALPCSKLLKIMCLQTTSYHEKKTKKQIKVVNNIITQRDSFTIKKQSLAVCHIVVLVKH